MTTLKLFARLENIGVRYAPKIVLQNLSLDVVEGAITRVIGLSGAGKSTILHLLNGLRRPDEGRVIVREREINALTERELNEIRRTIGFAFQVPRYSIRSRSARTSRCRCARTPR